MRPAPRSRARAGCRTPRRSRRASRHRRSRAGAQPSPRAAAVPAGVRAEARAVGDDPEFERRTAAPGETLDRQRVDHLVRDGHADERVRQAIQPFDPPGQVRHRGLDRRALPITQVRAHVEDPVVRGQRAERFEFGEHRRGHRPGTGADFEHVAAAETGEHLGALRGHAAAEHRRDLGCSDEIAGGPELARAGAVVTEPRRVEHELHVAVEADPAARSVDLGADARGHRLAVGAFRGRQRARVVRRAQGARPLPGTPAVVSGIVTPWTRQSHFEAAACS